MEIAELARSAHLAFHDKLGVKADPQIVDHISCRENDFYLSHMTFDQKVACAHCPAR